MSDSFPLFFLFILLVIVAIAFSAYMGYKRRKDLTAWAAARGLSFSPHRDHSFDERFPNFDCLRKSDNRYAYNIMEGDFQGRPFLGFDYHYETHSTDSKGRRKTHHHHFSAVILESEVLLDPLSIRPEGFFDKITEFLGWDDIDFESAEFSRRFHVKAPDRSWAFHVLHARTIEFLLSQPEFRIQFDARHVIAWKTSRFRPREFEESALVVHGILSRLPDYLVQERRIQILR